MADLEGLSTYTMKLVGLTKPLNQEVGEQTGHSKYNHKIKQWPWLTPVQDIKQVYQLIDRPQIAAKIQDLSFEGSLLPGLKWSFQCRLTGAAAHLTGQHPTGCCISGGGQSEEVTRCCGLV